MNRVSAVGGIVACTLSCAPGAAPAGDKAAKEQKPVEQPVEQPVETKSPPPPPLKTWQLRLTTQFFGTALGPLKEVTVDSGGAVEVLVDGKRVGERVLPAAEVEPLARLLAAPELAAAKSEGGPDMGPTARLVVTGDVAIDLRPPAPGLGPVMNEVDRLRDLVGPPEDFKVVAIAGDREVLVSSNGYVKVSRGGVEVAHHFLPMTALQPMIGMLGVTAIRDASAWSVAGPPTLTITGDVQAAGAVDTTIKGPASALYGEALRLGDVVEAKLRPPGAYELVVTRQLRGAGLGPPRTITVRAGDRTLVDVDGGPGAARRERVLGEDELRHLSTMLIDPDFRSAPLRGPSGEGMATRIVITGDAPLDVTFHGDPPPPVIALLNHIDHLASR